ncbi:hypothetical protein HG531_004718 [Fusarium graminearum]|nr:hypothetical protein HG531_004718 [Fusarium graminearum]
MAVPSPTTGASINDRGADNPGIDSLSLKNKGIGLSVEHVFVHSLDVVFIRIVPDLTLRIEVPRRSKVDKVSCTTYMNHFASGRTLLLASDDGCDWLGGEGVACVNSDIMFGAGGFDFVKVGEVANYDPVCVK